MPFHLLSKVVLLLGCSNYNAATSPANRIPAPILSAPLAPAPELGVAAPSLVSVVLPAERAAAPVLDRVIAEPVVAAALAAAPVREVAEQVAEEGRSVTPEPEHRSWAN